MRGVLGLGLMLNKSKVHKWALGKLRNEWKKVAQTKPVYQTGPWP